MSRQARWADLAPRLIYGALMAVVGLVLVWLGGWLFSLALGVLCGLMIWETGRMFGAPNPVPVAILCAVAVGIALVVPAIMVLPVLLAAAISGAGTVTRDKGLYASFATWVVIGCYAFAVLRLQAGFAWVLWMILIVVISDVAGYFAGRIFGGPKFWPRVSPKKTWSGTVAGWAGAAVIGAIFAGPLNAGPGLMLISMLVGFAGQMGDIAESAVKRKTGIKDSSTLIPGHGGVLDRFDAMLGAAVMMAVLWALNLLPGVS